MNRKKSKYIEKILYLEREKKISNKKNFALTIDIFIAEKVDLPLATASGNQPVVKWCKGTVVMHMGRVGTPTYTMCP